MKNNYRKLNKKLLFRLIGIAGCVTIFILFILYPSWPTPDKLLVFLTFLFMSFGQGWQLFKRMAPFVALLIVYESFRGLVPHLNNQVNYLFLPNADKFLFFGNLPTSILQNIMWDSQLKFYDFIFYGAYMLHFVLPVALGLLIWKYHDKFYWRYITTFLVVSFAGFLTYLAFPAAPPWMSSDLNIIEPIHRISSDVWYAFGIKDFPSFYNKISPNPVAAMPSLHAAYATLIFIFVYKLFGKKWGLIAAIYPILIYIGTIYQGEHYAIDEMAGILYAIGAYYAAPYLLKFFVLAKAHLKKRLSKLF
jgi:hypothetical protein